MRTIDYGGHTLDVELVDDELIIYENNEDVTHEFLDGDINAISEMINAAEQSEYEDNNYERLKRY